MVKKLLISIAFLSTTIYADEVSAYIKGVNDTLSFLKAEAKVQIPNKKYWLAIDVSNMPFWKILALANVIRERIGIYPAYVYSEITFKKFLVPIADNDKNAVKSLIKPYKEMYPKTKIYLLEVDDPNVFKPVIRVGICELPKPKMEETNILELLKEAKREAEREKDSVLIKYIDKTIKQVEKYLKFKKNNELGF